MKSALIRVGFSIFFALNLPFAYSHDMDDCDFLLLPEISSPHNPHATVGTKVPKILYGQIKSSRDKGKRLIGAHSSELITIDRFYRKREIQGARIGKDGRIKLLFRKKYGQPEEVNLTLHPDFSLSEGFVRNPDGTFSRDLNDLRIRPFPVWVSEKTQTIQIELRKRYEDESGQWQWTRSKMSTLAPLSWSDSKVVEATHILLRARHKVARRGADGSTLYRGKVWGLPWVVVVDGKNNVTASFSTGENIFSRISFQK